MLIDAGDSNEKTPAARAMQDGEEEKRDLEKGDSQTTALVDSSTTAFAKPKTGETAAGNVFSAEAPTARQSKRRQLLSPVKNAATVPKLPSLRARQPEVEALETVLVTPVNRSNRIIQRFAQASERSSEITPEDAFATTSNKHLKAFCKCCKGTKLKPGTAGYQAYLSYLTLGIIYGDIGTSPLYTFTSIFAEVPPSETHVIGALSAMLWSLIVIAAIKYQLFVLLADDHGEGGTFSLFALVSRGLGSTGSDAKKFKLLNRAITVISIIGVSAVLADGVLTPAISITGAIAGVSVAAPALGQGAVVGISCFILILLFLPQKYGTSRISLWFSPIVLIWFLALGSIGVYNITRVPRVLAAFNPVEAFVFLGENGFQSWSQLGGVFLTVTGSEAMFADLGHFNAKAVRLSWFVLVMPSLMLCYCGQAAALVENPTVISNTFYKSIPEPLFYPMLVLATLAAIIASQAMITASFSIVAQAMRLNFFPRLDIHHTDKHQFGQIYISEINYFLMVLIVIVVIAFQNATALGYAYGITVSLAFFITAVLYSVVISVHFHRHWVFSLAFFLIFGFIDANFLAANLLKFPAGGWFSVAICSALSAMLLIWKYGRFRMLKAQVALNSEFSELYVPRNPDGSVAESGIVQVGALKLLICFASQNSKVPASFVHFAKRIPIRPSALAFVKIVALNVAFVENDFECELVAGFQDTYSVIVYHGYAEKPPTAKLIATRVAEEVGAVPSRMRYFPPPSEAELFAAIDPTFLIGRDYAVAKPNSWFLHRYLVDIFGFMLSLARSPLSGVDIPPESVLSIGVQVKI